MRDLYIYQLESDLKTKIKDGLIEFFKEELKLSEEDLRVELELAMNSRVSDLEDTINIDRILHQP